MVKDWRVRLLVVVTAALLGAVAAQVVLARNTHSVNNVYHGLGDGADADYHVHAFNDRPHRQIRRANTVTIGHKGRGYFLRVRSKARHLHIDWDTGSRRECQYYSHHWVKGKLNGNAHTHHYDCR
jgi:hypothetical protein